LQQQHQRRDNQQQLESEACLALRRHPAREAARGDRADAVATDDGQIQCREHGFIQLPVIQHDGGRAADVHMQRDEGQSAGQCQQQKLGVTQHGEIVSQQRLDLQRCPPLARVRLRQSLRGKDE